MESNIKIIADDILNASEKAIIVPCSTKAGNSGRGVDSAIYSKYGNVKKKWEDWFRKNKDKKAMDFGEVYTVEDNGKVFILVAVPLMNEKNYYYCNLETCYSNAFKKAYEYGCESIACPLIGTGGALKWPIGEAFYSLYAIHKEYKNYFKVTLYLKNNEAIEYAQKNNWDIALCFDEKPLDNRIDYMINNGYELYESNYLKTWYAEKEKIKRRNNPKEQLEPESRFLLSLAAFERLSSLNYHQNKEIIEIDIAKRSGLSKNTVSCIFTGNDRVNIDKEILLAFGYAMQCSYGTICNWLKIIGLCFNDSERDKFIEDAFKNRTSNDVKYLNIKLKNRGLSPLQTADYDAQRKEFADKLREQINTIQALSGSTFRDNELAQKSGMNANAVLAIRKAKAEFKPQKDKIISLAAALRCTTNQLEEWLKIFGMALSENKRDSIIRKAFDERSVRDAHELNSLLINNNCQHLKVTAFNPSRSKYKEVEL